MMTVDVTILTARHGMAQSINQSVVSLRLFVKPFLQNFIRNHETMMLIGTGELRRRGLHILRFRASTKAYAFRRSSSPHKNFVFAGSPLL